VGKLAQLSAQLRKSVSGFRLPDSASGGTSLLTDSLKRPGAPTATPTQVRPTPLPPTTPAPKKVSGLNA
ncbi:MAG: hypothetical protein ACREUC_05445, partial [Steroidobacteraceae bacterium]